MNSLRGIFSEEKKPQPRTRSVTRSLPPFATYEPLPKPQRLRSQAQQKPTIRSAIITQTKNAPKPKPLPHAHAPEGAEFHQRRSKFVQCRNQSSQTDIIPDVVDATSKLQDLEIDVPVTTEKPREKKKLTERSTARSKKMAKPVPIDPDCPPGHVALADGEKEEMKRNLEKLYAELLAELNRLPICVDTLRVRTRRVALDKHLQETEDKIKLLGKPKVYVPATQ